MNSSPTASVERLDPSRPFTLSPARVLIVDDHPFLSDAIAEWLNRQPGLLCCGCATSITAGRRAIYELQPNIVLMDIRLGDGNGLDLTAEIAAVFPQMRFIIFSQEPESAYGTRAFQAGASAYVMKTSSPDALLAALENARRELLADQVPQI